MNNLGNVLTAIKLAAGFLPVLVQMIQSAESAFPGLVGSQKLAVVKGAIQTAYEAEQGLEAPFTAIWPVFNSIITTVVNAFNAVGLFSHATPAQAPDKPL